MATEILMPALSPTMEEGTLAKWLKKEGDEVRSGDIIAEIETDKATMEFEAVDEGILGKILIAEGTAGVKVNTPIAVLVEEGESVDAVSSAKVPEPQEPADEAAPAQGGSEGGPCPGRQGARGAGGPIRGRARLRLAARPPDRQGEGGSTLPRCRARARAAGS